jgi:hypothetical protein
MIAKFNLLSSAITAHKDELAKHCDNSCVAKPTGDHLNWRQAINGATAMLLLPPAYEL